MKKYQLILEAIRQFGEQDERCRQELSCEIGIADLKTKQFRYLEIINTYEHLTFSKFAEILQITKPSVTEIVMQLINLDCVQKQQCHRDGRCYYIELSARGKRIVQFNLLKHQRLAEKIINSLTEEEMDLFVGLLRKIN